MCSGKKDTRSFRCIFDFKNINLDSLSWFKFFTFYLLVFTEDTVCLTEVYADVLAHHTLYDTGNNFFFHSVILIIKNFTLFFTNFLNNNLFCFLSCNTAKILWCCFLSDHISYDLARISYSCLCNRNLSCLIFYFLYYFFIQINMKFSCFTV